MRITVRQLKRIINEEVKRVILEAGVHHDTSGLTPDAVERYHELWDMLQSNEDYLSLINDGILDGETPDWELEDFIYVKTEANRFGVDEFVVSKLAQNILNDLS